MKSLLIISIATILSVTSCSNGGTEHSTAKEESTQSAAKIMDKDSMVSISDHLKLLQVSKHVYQHISFLNTKDFGRVECNGMLVVHNGQAVIFDTPADNDGSEDLINYVTQNLRAKILAVIPCHFHEDCVGGIEKFKEHTIPAYASNRTINILKLKGNKYADYIKGFDDSLTLNVGGEKVHARYLGAGHTSDNIVGYFPEDSVLFGGCLIKELNAKKGNLEDADLAAWPNTVLKVKQQYPEAKIVIPGHGKSGGIDLLNYTIELFK